MFENFSFENLLKIENCKLKIILVFLAICYLFAISKTYASGLSLGVYPPIIQIQADPPANIDSPITIQNLGSETVNLDIILKPFTAKDSENGEIKYLLEKDGVPGANPLILQKIQILEGDHAVKNITLAPSEQKKLNFHIGISKDEPISDYYFSVVFLNNPNTPARNASQRDAGGPNLPNSPNSQAQGGVAVNVLLSIGKGQAKGIIEEFSSPIFLEKGPVPFVVRIKNTGKHVIAPIGQILIKNFFGQTVGKVDLLPVNILSGTTRAIPSSPTQSLQDHRPPPSKGGGNDGSNFSPLSQRGEIKRGVPTATWPEKFLLGPYTATLTLALSDEGLALSEAEGPVYKKTINFFGAPTQIFIGLIIAIMLVSLIVGKVRKRLLTNN